LPIEAIANCQLPIEAILRLPIANCRLREHCQLPIGYFGEVIFVKESKFPKTSMQNVNRQLAIGNRQCSLNWQSAMSSIGNDFEAD
jgi:hypothetical protein